MGEKTEAGNLLIVDDAPDTLEVLQRNLTTCGYVVYTATDVEGALRVLDHASIDLVITDYKMPRVSGLDLVRHVRENLKNTEVMMITGHASIDGAIEAVKSGAEEYLAKPFTDTELSEAVSRILAKRQARFAAHEDPPVRSTPFHGILGRSTVMCNVLRDIKKASNTPVTVLITGESGSGKELAARAIHYSSERGSAPFIAVNCGGIPEGLLESELFGHVKGSFTGATDSRAGFFLTADGGTIFLDEIAETSLAMQVKLLRVLEDKQVQMVGDSRPRHVDVRVVAATNKDLLSLVKKEVFREDLYFRLSVLAVNLPPLRDRGDDVLLLTNHFVQKFAHDFDRPPLEFSDAALQALKDYYWPGNVRELENVIQQLTVMSDDPRIDVPDFPPLMRSNLLPRGGLLRSLAEVEVEHIRDVLASVKGNKSRAAEILGIDRKTLRERLKKHD